MQRGSHLIGPCAHDPITFVIVCTCFYMYCVSQCVAVCYCVCVCVCVCVCTIARHGNNCKTCPVELTSYVHCFAKYRTQTRGGYRRGAWGAGTPSPLPPPLFVLKGKSPADIAYGCWGISSLTSTIASTAASSRLQVSMTILSVV